MKGFSGFVPTKPKSMMEAKVKQVEKPINPDSSTHLSAVPTFSDQVSTANIDMRNKKAAPPKKVKHKDDMNSPMTKKGKCSCYDGYSRVKGTKPCASGSCEESPASKNINNG